ncbi:MAG: anaerobic sulfatase maturase [Oscillospiraceae bacterium]|nr:anaerobic sulfatase maturase [Oscillospiraceae bacterium]
MPPVSVLIKPASGNCNMRCSYCFYCDEMANRAEAQYGIMQQQTLESVVKKVLRTAEGSCSFAFQGGEPTLAGLDFFKNAVALQKSYNARGLQISNALQTNGYALSEEWAVFFKENNFLIGLSLDGTEVLHDMFRKDARGEGTFQPVLAAAKLLQKHGVQFNILTVVNAETAKRGKEIYRFFKEQGFGWLQFIPCLDPLDGAAQPYSLTAKAYGKFLCDVFSLWYKDVLRGDAPSVRTFDNWLGMLLGYPPEECGMCGQCAAYFCVEADGSAYPCDFYVLDEYKLGSFTQHSIVQMNERRRELRFVQQSLAVPQKCRECRWYSLCRNGCRRAREEGVNRFCEGYRMFFETCGERLAILAKHVLNK